LFPNPTPKRSFEVGEVTVLKDDPLSVDLTMVPEIPTAVTSAITGAVVSGELELGELELLVDSSLSSLQEITERLKRDMRIMYNT